MPKIEALFEFKKEIKKISAMPKFRSNKTRWVQSFLLSHKIAYTQEQNNDCFEFQC